MWEGGWIPRWGRGLDPSMGQRQCLSLCTGAGSHGDLDPRRAAAVVGGGCPRAASATTA